MAASLAATPRVLILDRLEEATLFAPVEWGGRLLADGGAFVDLAALPIRARRIILAAEVLQAIEAGVFHPNPGWHCKDCPFRSRCWAWS